MQYTKLVEEIAIKIFLYEGGMYPDEYEKCMGVKKNHWDKYHAFQKEEDCLAEHERDDYRLQATKVVEYLLHNDLLDVCKTEVFSESTH